MAPSIWQLLIVLAVALLLFGGRGKISSIMGDMAKGIRSFKKGLSEEEEAARKGAIPEGKETIEMTPLSKEKSKS
jgi:sec-independent protein translocase protein TatA